MIYPLAMVILVPVFASLADRDDRRVLLVTGGGLLAGLGTLLVLGDPDNVFLLGAMLLLLGLGQAMSIAPQSALVGAFGKRLAAPVAEGSLYGVFRLIERSGSALGPVLGGLLLGLYGFSTAVMTIGLTVALGAALFGLAVAAAQRSGKAAQGDGMAGEITIPGHQLLLRRCEGAPAAAQVPQEMRLLPEGSLVGGQGSQVVAIESGEALVSEAPAEFRSAAHQFHALGPEEDRGQPPHQFRATADDLAVQAEPPAAAAVEPELEAMRRLPLVGHLEGHVQRVAPEADHLLGPGAAVGAAEGQEVQRLEHVGLALAVLAQQEVHAGREDHLLVGQVAESGPAGGEDLHDRTVLRLGRPSGPDGTGPLRARSRRPRGLVRPVTS